MDMSKRVYNIILPPKYHSWSIILVLSIIQQDNEGEIFCAMWGHGTYKGMMWLLFQFPAPPIFLLVPHSREPAAQFLPNMIRPAIYTEIFSSNCQKLLVSTQLEAGRLQDMRSKSRAEGEDTGLIYPSDGTFHIPN